MRITADAAEAPMTALRSGKSQAAFRTISEVADELDVAQHVLRFWESKFPQVRPLKRGGGRRYYRPEDIDVLRDIRCLLYDEGYTIKGAQKLLRQRRARPTASPAAKAVPSSAPAARPADEPDDGESGPLQQGVDDAAAPLTMLPDTAAHAPAPESPAAPDAETAVDAPPLSTAVAEVETLRQLRATLDAVRRDLDTLLADEG